MFNVFRATHKLTSLRRQLFQKQPLLECGRKPCVCVDMLRQTDAHKTPEKYARIKKEYEYCCTSRRHWKNSLL